MRSVWPQAVIVLILLNACGVVIDSLGTENKSSISVDEQDIDLYSRVVVSKLDIDRDSFLVIQESDALDLPSTVLFSKRYLAGLYDDEIIELEKPVEASTSGDGLFLLHASVFSDTNENGVFDEGVDKVARDASGNAIGTSFRMKETDLSAHVAVSLSSNGNSDYVWTEVSDVLDAFEINTDTLAITMEEGRKYRIINTQSTSHPLSFRDASGNIIWRQGAGSEFVVDVSEEFAQNVASYRCVTHFLMKGGVGIK